MDGTHGMPWAWGLGVVAHGPAVLAQAPGVGVGLRCAFGYPEGLLLSTELKALGLPAQEITEVSLRPRSGRSGRRVPRAPRPFSRLQFEVLQDDAPLTLDVTHQVEGHHGRGDLDAGTFTPATTIELDVWLSAPWIAGPNHPRPGEDGTLTIRTGWPEVGLPITTTVLELAVPKYFHHAPQALR